MPNIKIYNAPQMGTSQLRPNEEGMGASQQSARTAERLADQSAGQLSMVGRGQERAAQAGATALRDVAAGVTEIGGALAYHVAEHQEQQEITKEASDHITSLNALVQDYDKARANADPNDPSYADKWKQEKLEPFLQSYPEGYSTKAGRDRASGHAAQILDTFDKIIASDQSTRAGAAARMNFETFSNQSADLLTRNPEMLDVTNAAAKDLVDGLKSSSLMTDPQRAQMDEHLQKTRTENTMAAFRGLAERGSTPEEQMASAVKAKAMLDGGFGKGDLPEAQRNQLDAYAKTMVELGERKIKAAREDQDKQDRKNYDSATNGLIVNHTDADGNFTDKAGFIEDIKSKIAPMPGAPAGAAAEWLRYANSQANKPPSVSSSAAIDLLRQKQEAGTLTRDDFMAAVNNNDLSRTDKAYYQKVSDPAYQTPERRQMYKSVNKIISDYKVPILQGGQIFNTAPTLEAEGRYERFRQQLTSIAEEAAARHDGSLQKVLAPEAVQKFALQFAAPTGKAAAAQAAHDAVIAAQPKNAPPDAAAQKAKELDDLLKPKGN